MSNKTQSQGTENYIQNVASTALPHFHQCGIRLPLSMSLDPLHGHTVVQFPL